MIFRRDISHSRLATAVGIAFLIWSFIHSTKFYFKIHLSAIKLQIMLEFVVWYSSIFMFFLSKDCGP